MVAALAAAGHGVRAATRLPTEFPPGVERVLVPDFTRPIDWEPVLRGVRLVVHTAGLAHADSSEIPVDLFDRINRIATQDLARAAARAGVAHFVFISSVRAQIGASAPRVLHETDEPHPTDRYGRSKLDAELAVRAAGVPFTIIRPVVIYGPDAKANIRLLIRLASLPLPLPFAAFGNRRSILGVDNLVSAILFALDHPATIGETYLIADPDSGRAARHLRDAAPRARAPPRPPLRSARAVSARADRARPSLPVGADRRRAGGRHRQVRIARLAAGGRHIRRPRRDAARSRAGAEVAPRGASG